MVAVNLAIGGTQTTTVCVVLVESPQRLNETNRTENVPLVAYVCEAVDPVPVVPSPKYHFQRTAFTDEVAVVFRILPLVVYVNAEVTGPQTATVSPNTAESPHAFLTINRT